MDKPLQILIVDDEVYVRIIIKAYFAPYNTVLFEAKNGSEAIEIMKEKEMDLVILDYTMPLVNGQEVMNRMQLDPNLANIPVIIYTAGGFEIEIENWLRESSAAFLEKTNLGDDLLPTIKDILGSRLKKKIED